MKTFITAFLLLCPLSLLSAEPEEKTTVAGTILEETSGSPVPGANIVVKSNGKMKAFASSDEDGKFSLAIQKNLPDLSITVSAAGYKTYSSPLNYADSPLTVILADGALQLKEVVVKSKPITAEGDTLTYTVSSFAQSQDRSIGDVLRRMPGIDVAESGKIKYQGSEINKFYIEGSDLLEGKYGIATNGIDHRDVGAVEVMENHQPIRVLQGYSISDQAAINLKLKDQAKAKLTGHGMIGAGAATQPHGFVWDTEGFLSGWQSDACISRWREEWQVSSAHSQLTSPTHLSRTKTSSNLSRPIISASSSHPPSNGHTAVWKRI
ncbi:MAG: TonB-dependent receptor [Muribaculaceae bacterium]|nr:TonB-dependent receptor [Muribaculaceae bacterium]